MQIKENQIFFYGKLAGEIKNGIAYVKKEFQCGEMASELMIFGYKTVWEDNK